MNAAFRAAESTDIGNPTLNILIFGVFVVITLGIVLRAGFELVLDPGFPAHLLEARDIRQPCAERYAVQRNPFKRGG